MFNPKLILGEDILATELAALPIHSLFVAATVPPYVLVAFLQIQRNSTLATLGKAMGLLAVA